MSVRPIDRPIEEIQASEAFRETMIPKADHVRHSGVPMWFGWVIMDAYLAGIDYGRAHPDSSNSGERG